MGMNEFPDAGFLDDSYPMEPREATWRLEKICGEARKGSKNVGFFGVSTMARVARGDGRLGGVVREEYF